MQILSSLSQNPIAAHAVGETLADILEKQNEEIDVVIVGASEHFVGTLPDIMSAISTILTPRKVGLVCTSGVIGAGFLQQAGCAIALTTFSPQENLDLLFCADAESAAVTTASTLVIATPLSFSQPTFSFDVFAQNHPSTNIIGGVVNSDSLDGARLGYDTEVFSGGALLLTGDFDLAATQALCPISDELVVTKAHGAMVMELNHQPALSVLYDAVALSLSDSDDFFENETRRLARQQLVTSLCLITTTDGPVKILGADRTTQSIALGSAVPVGTTVQIAGADESMTTQDLIATLSGGEVFAPAALGGFMLGQLTTTLMETAADTLRTSAIGGFNASPIFAQDGQGKFLSLNGSTTAIFGRHHY